MTSYDVSKVSSIAKGLITAGETLTYQLTLRNKNISVVVLNPMSKIGTVDNIEYSVTKTVYLPIGTKRKAMGSTTLQPTTTSNGMIYEYLSQLELEGYQIVT